jgi:hypothetical protein
VVGNLVDIPEQSEQQAQKPRVERRVRMALHFHHLAQEHVTGMRGMQRVNLCMLGASQIVNVVALNRLIEERRAQEEDQDEQKEQAARHYLSGRQRRIGLRAAVTSSTRLVRVV